MERWINAHALPYKLGVFSDGSQMIYVRAEDIQCAKEITLDDIIPKGEWVNETKIRPHLYRWVPLNSVVCTNCDKSNNTRSKYCPNCGAKMS